MQHSDETSLPTLLNFCLIAGQRAELPSFWLWQHPCCHQRWADSMAIEPLPNDADRPPNVALIPIAVGRWPVLFMVAIQELKAGMSQS